MHLSKNVPLCYWLPIKRNSLIRAFSVFASDRENVRNIAALWKIFLKFRDHISPPTKTRRLNFDTNFHSSTTNDAEISHSDTTKPSVWNSPSFHFHTKYEKWAYSVSFASFDYDCKCVSSHRPCLSEEVLKWLMLLMVLLRCIMVIP